MTAESGPSGTSFRELALRVLSALVLIAVALAVTWRGGAYFWTMCALVGVLVLLEFLAIVGVAVTSLSGLVVFGFYAAILAVWAIAGVGWAMAVLLVGTLVTAVAARSDGSGNWPATGLVYAVLPIFALVLLRGDEPGAVVAVLILFATVWGADTAAYFVGRRVGGPKLAPAISPKKTWSGFFGGLAGGVVAAIAVAHVFATGAGWAGAAIAVLLGVGASVGDLFESWVKRRFGRKDSGRLIPGHGGVLDRIDGLVFAALLAWAVGWLAGGQPAAPGSTGIAFANAFLWN